MLGERKIFLAATTVMSDALFKHALYASSNFCVMGRLFWSENIPKLDVIKLDRKHMCLGRDSSVVVVGINSKYLIHAGCKVKREYREMG